jgi:AcrR family transcriptional regulator
VRETVRDVPRSEARQRLVEAALSVFGERGFDGASTRAIAAAADANIAAIPYYFGGKSGLYLAVAEHIADQLLDRLGSALEAADRLSRDPDTSVEQARAVVTAIADRFVAIMIGSPEAAGWARFIVREQFDPTDAFDVLYERVMDRSYRIIGALLGRILGRDPDREEIRLKVFSLIGQVLIFRIARPAVLRRMGWEEYSADHVAAIQAVVRDNLAAILRAEPRS